MRGRINMHFVGPLLLPVLVEIECGFRLTCGWKLYWQYPIAMFLGPQGYVLPIKTWKRPTELSLGSSKHHQDHANKLIKMSKLL